MVRRASRRAAAGRRGGKGQLGRGGRVAGRGAAARGARGAHVAGLCRRGWVAGAGFEHMLTQNLSARFEYLYYGFDGINAPAGTLDVNATKIDLSSQVVRFGLNYKF